MESMIFAMLAGISVTLQNSFNGLMTPVIGAMGASLASFVIQMILIGSVQFGKERSFACVKRVPLLYYGSGLISTVVVAAIGLCVARMGSAVTQCCSVAGQILMSALVDHFGLFGSRKNPFALQRLPGFCLILAGVFTMNLLGGDASSLPAGFLLLALGLGALAIVVRTMNYKATRHAGSSLGGGLVNSISGAFGALLFFVLLSGFKPDFRGFMEVNPIYYLAGAFGAACCLCNIASYRKQKIFYATIFMLIGQVVTGIAMDLLVFHVLSAGRVIGIAVILAGICMDKVLTRK